MENVENIHVRPEELAAVVNRLMDALRAVREKHVDRPMAVMPRDLAIIMGFVSHLLREGAR